MLRAACLTLSRFAIAAWVGAAGLFLVTTLQDVHSPDLDSVAKAEIVVRRFPVYYSFAFGLLATALVLAIPGLRSAGTTHRRITLSLLLVTLILTTIDYFTIYLPLEEMTAAVEKPRPAEFIDYHEWSKNINTAQITIAVVAAMAVCWPVGRGSDEN